MWRIHNNFKYVKVKMKILNIYFLKILSIKMAINFFKFNVS